MNYQRIYDQIVDRAKQEERKKSDTTYYESHHILPKCMGGCNSRENLVLLTGREHFLTHWILARIHPANKKIAYAFWLMCNPKNKSQEKRHTPGSRAYGEAREGFSTALIAFYQTAEGKESKRNSVINTDYAVVSAKRTANTDYVARSINYDWESKAKKCMKPITQYEKDGTFVGEWPSIKEAGKTLGIDLGNITSNCKGDIKSAGGFIWKYKEKELEN